MVMVNWREVWLSTHGFPERRDVATHNFVEESEKVFDEYDMMEDRKGVYEITPCIDIVTTWQKLECFTPTTRSKKSDTRFINACIEESTHKFQHIGYYPSVVYIDTMLYVSVMLGYYIDNDADMVALITEFLTSLSPTDLLGFELVPHWWKCIASSDNRVRNTYLNIFKKTQTQLRPLLDDIESLPTNINENWQRAEAQLALLSTITLSYDTDHEELYETISNCISTTKNPNLFATAAHAYANLMRDVEIPDEIKRRAFNTLVPFVTSDDMLVRISALEAVVIISDFNLSEYDKRICAETTRVLAPIILEKIDPLLNDKLLDPTIIEYYCERYLEISSKLLSGPVRKRIRHNLQYNLALLWLSSLSMAVDLTTDEKAKILKLLAMVIKQDHDEIGFERAMLCLCDFLPNYQNNLAPFIDSVMSTVFDRLEQYIVQPSTFEVDRNYTEGSIYPYRSIMCISIENLSPTHLDNIILTEDRIKRLRNIVETGVKGGQAAREVSYYIIFNLTNSKVATRLWTEQQQYDLFLSIIPPALVDACLRKTPQTYSCIEAFLLRSAQCFILGFLRDVINFRENPQELWHIFSDSFDFILRWYSGYMSDVEETRLAHSLTVANFAHIISVMYFVFGDKITARLGQGVCDIIVFTLLNEEFDLRDNIDLGTALASMIEDFVSSEGTMSEFDLLRICSMLGILQMEMNETCPEFMPSLVAELKRCTVMMNVLKASIRNAD
jgi:hypothetical protein